MKELTIEGFTRNSEPVLDKNRRDARILIVDDEASHIQLLKDVFRSDGYSHVKGLCDPRGFFALLIEFRPDILILDLQMPYIDGFQLLESLRSMSDQQAHLPVLIISAACRGEARIRALAAGASDAIAKPFMAREVSLRVEHLLDGHFQYLSLQRRNEWLEQEVMHRTVEMEGYQLELRETQIEMIHRLARAAEHHDDDTAQHTQRVALICTLLGQNMGLPEEQVTLLRQAAPLHDVGKIGVPDSILLKPGILSEAELKIMRRHCTIGADLLSNGHSELVQIAERIALYHHEKWDGSGYPHGVSGTDIDINGRILAVADVFDALTHERPYKKAWSVEEAIDEIENQSGRHFDPEVVEAFMTLPHDDLL